jgi:transcription-repair coupling factor (superfamily II helicase)
LSLEYVRQCFSQAPVFRDLQDAIARPQASIHLKGMSGSAISFLLAETFKAQKTPFLLVFNDKEEAAYYLNDLEELISRDDVLFYPGSYRRPYEIEETDNANVLLRAEVLNRINSRRKPALIVSYPDALFEKVVTRKELERNTLKVRTGDTLSLDFLNEVLFEYHFKRVDFVSEPGEFSVRGGIVDVFSFSHDEPYRIEFFGDEVDSIRSFDVETQLSTDRVRKITIIPNVADKILHEARVSFLEYISSNTTVFLKNPSLCQGRLDQLFTKALEAFKNMSTEVSHASPESLFLNGSQLRTTVQGYRKIALEGPLPEEYPGVETLEIPARPQPAFNKHFDLLLSNLRENKESGMQNYIFCAS